MSFQWGWLHRSQSNETWSWCDLFGLVWTRWAKKKYEVRSKKYQWSKYKIDYFWALVAPPISTVSHLILYFFTFYFPFNFLMQNCSFQFPTGLSQAISEWHEGTYNWIRPKCSGKMSVVKYQQQPALVGSYRHYYCHHCHYCYHHFY